MDSADSRASAPAPARSALLQACDLECIRGERQLFDGVDFTLDPGEAAQVHGPNGSGKTSLLRIVCGLSLPEAGEVRWRDRTVVPGPRDHVGEIHYVGHANGIKDGLTPHENLEFAARLHGTRGRCTALEALERMGIAAYRDVPARSLSAGQRRRTALARLLLVPATLWVLDEPFTALDTDGSATLREVIDEHVASGGAVLLTSHQPVELPSGTPQRVVLAP